LDRAGSGLYLVPIFGIIALLIFHFMTTLHLAYRSVQPIFLEHVKSHFIVPRIAFEMSRLFLFKLMQQ
jgi:hypothetical protein